MVAVIERRPEYKQTVIHQLEALFDETVWEGWIDKAHVHFGHPADLRTGMLSESVGLTYDWLRAYLSEAEKQFILDGLDRCGIQPFLQSKREDAWWLRDLSNWLTTIVGGVGIAAMALDSAHPASSSIIEYANQRMEEYLSIYGPSGEFNESVHYANATVRPVSYFEAHRYWSGGRANRLAQRPFPETCLWQLYLTLPPGRVAAFGDANPTAKPWTKHFAAIAAATRNPVLQWFYRYHRASNPDPIELLWFDQSLPTRSPAEAGLPAGRAFPAHGGCLISRSDWDPESASCIAYGKSGREENHEHNDVGQLCIDGNGERLIVDIGSPKPVYPADFFDEGRYEYYNASTLGHNVLMINGTEQRYPTRERGTDINSMASERSGRILLSDFDDKLGGVWQLDLSGAYRQPGRVVRTVVHLLPGCVVVHDLAVLERASVCSLRWHMAAPAAIDSEGRFSLRTASSQLIGRMVSLSGPVELALRRHEYRPPYDKGRGNIPLEQRSEPFVEATTHGSRIELISLFLIEGRAEGDDFSGWMDGQSGWIASGRDQAVSVRFENRMLTARSNPGEHVRRIEV
jgi:hypothetical protein